MKEGAAPTARYDARSGLVPVAVPVGRGYLETGQRGSDTREGMAAQRSFRHRLGPAAALILCALVPVGMTAQAQTTVVITDRNVVMPRSTNHMPPSCRASRERRDRTDVGGALNRL